MQDWKRGLGTQLESMTGMNSLEVLRIWSAERFLELSRFRETE